MLCFQFLHLQNKSFSPRIKYTAQKKIEPRIQSGFKFKFKKAESDVSVDDRVPPAHRCKIWASWDGVSLKTPRPRGWVRAGRPSGGESSFNKRNMYQYPHVSQLFILTSVAKPGIPGAIKNGWVCTADYRMLLGTAVRPVPARMPYISRLCDVGATDVKRWWWWWWIKISNFKNA